MRRYSCFGLYCVGFQLSISHIWHSSSFAKVPFASNTTLHWGKEWWRRYRHLKSTSDRIYRAKHHEFVVLRGSQHFEKHLFISFHIFSLPPSPATCSKPFEVVPFQPHHGLSGLPGVGRGDVFSSDIGKVGPGRMPCHPGNQSEAYPWTVDEINPHGGPVTSLFKGNRSSENQPM